MTRTRERHSAVHALLGKGFSLNAISRELGWCFRTVQRFAQAENPDELLVGTLTKASSLDRFKPYVHHRWNQGCTNASELLTELRALGWRGGLRTLQRYVRLLRPLTAAPAAPVAPPPPLTPRRVTQWIMTNPEHLGAGNTVRLGQVNRIKSVKRAMFGRANFDLLRQRILLRV